MDTVRATVESSNSFVFVACCAYLDALAPLHPSSVLALRPRDPDFKLFCVARDEGSVTFRGELVHYRIETSDPVAADPKPEPFRQLHFTTHADRSTLLELIRTAVEHHRQRLSAPRGQPGLLMRYSWDDDAECWDGGKMIHQRPLDTLFLPMGVAEDVLDDLSAYLRPDTLDKYAALHVAPVRVYMLYGVPGGGKTSLVHCLASETSNNLAVLNFSRATSDRDIEVALRNLPPRCFLCIEDVDCLFDHRSGKNHGVSFASLLSALDGYAFSGDCLTVFLTTNAIDALDPAIRRRVDVAVEFSWASKYQCKRMFAAFFPDHPGFETVWNSLSKHKFSTSIMHKILVRSLGRNDPMACVDFAETLLHCTYGSSHGSSTDAQAMYS